AQAAERLQDLVVRRLVDVEVGAELGSRGLPAELRGQLLPAAAQTPLELLDPAWGTHAPSVVAEVPQDLTPDGGDGERQQVVVQGAVVTGDCLDQSLARRLLEVLERDATAAVAGR